MSIESAINDVAASLGVNPGNLTKLINFESNFDPKARNPLSSARGLIQFTMDTARSLGFKDSDDLINRYPDVESQLRGPVLSYLSQFKPFSEPFPQSLYLSVFYPQYRYSPPDTAFSDMIKKVNPGINFVSDYVNKVEKKKPKVVSLSKFSAIGFVVPVGLAALAIVYLHLKRRWKNEPKRRESIGRCG
jgi:hypothetical protein